MSGTSLTFAFDSTPIQLHLARLAVAHRRGFAELRRDIGEFFRADIQENIDQQKLFDGSPMEQSEVALGRTTHWKRDNAKKGRVKGEVRKAGKTLIDKHHLYDSYNYQLEGLGVAVGSNLVYAAIHHFGGETGRKGHRFTLPARPVMGVGERQERRIGDLLIAELRALQ